MQEDRLIKIIKAIILSSDKYVSIDEIEEAFSVDDKVARADIKKAISKIEQEDDGTQKLVKLSGEYRFQIREEFTPWVKRFKGESDARLSRSLLETLAIIAYKQPVSRGKIALIRGVETHLTVYQQLEERGWIRIAGYGGEYGQAMLYATTKKFLQYFGLNSVNELPELPELNASKIL